MIAYTQRRMIPMILAPLAVANVAAWTLLAGYPVVGLAWAGLLVVVAALDGRL